jgi:hypothetical protein
MPVGNKLTSAKSIRSFIDEVIQESLENVKRSKLHQKAIDEKDKQQSLASATGGGDDDESLDSVLGGDGSDQGNASEPEPDDGMQPDDDGGDDGQDTASKDKETLGNGEVKLDDVIDKLNTIRSGKSFKDSAIKSAMEKYVNDLETPEKTALLAFLKGIAQIVTGEIPGDTATEPGDNPSSVKMQKNDSGNSGGGHPQKKTLKPNVIRSPGSQKQPEEPQKHAGKKPTGGAEDTSGPAPIVPKRRG